MDNDALLTVAEVAEQLGISRYQVYRRIQRGNLPSQQARKGNLHYLVRQSDVHAYNAAGGANVMNAARLTEDYEPTLRVAQVAILTGFSAETVRHLCREGRLPSVKGYGPRGQYRIPVSAVDELLHSPPVFPAG